MAEERRGARNQEIFDDRDDARVVIEVVACFRAHAENEGEHNRDRLSIEEAHMCGERGRAIRASRSSLAVAFGSSMTCELLRMATLALLFVVSDCVFMVCDSIKSVGYGRNGQGFRYH